MRTKIDAKIQCQVNFGILEKVDITEWAAPIASASNGEIRLCGDYKVSINPHLKINQYPLPHPEVLFAALNGEVHFTKLDLSETYPSHWEGLKISEQVLSQLQQHNFHIN